MIPDVLIYPTAVFWAAGLFLVLFRRGIFWGWKLGSFVLLVFFVVWFRDPVMAGYVAFRDHFGTSLFAVLSALWMEAGRSLHLLWPLLLFIAFFMASDRGAAGTLRAMVILTVFFWLFFFLFRSLPPGWEHSLESRLPEKIHLPSLPAPPPRETTPLLPGKGQGPIRP